MTTRILPSFTLILPTSIEETIKLVAEYRGKAKILAGGTDVLVLMKNGMIAPKVLIKIGKVKELHFIKCSLKKGLRLGPLATIRDIERSAKIGDMYPLMVEAARAFGNIQIQNMATVGGNICNASPAGDMIIPLLAMNAEIELMASGRKKTLKLMEFFSGPGKSVLKPNEILVGIKALPLSQRYGSCFIKISRTAEDLSKISVATVLTVRNTKFRDVRLSLGSVAPTPIKAVNTENYLEGREVSEKVIDEAVAIACNEIKPISDNRSTAKYRKEVAGVVIKRAIKKALDRRSIQ